MQRLTENKIVLVTRRTRLDDLVGRFNTVSQAKFYVEHLGADFSDYLEEDRRYKQALKSAEATLRTLGRVQVLDRFYLPNFVFGDADTVVVLGQDGLVANTLKYLTRQPVIGVNPDPQRWDGVLLPFTVDDLRKILPDTFTAKRPMQEVTMARAELNNGLSMYAVNDFFIGARTHVSARYLLKFGEKQERQSSSGIIVSTGLGSTGWFKSLLAGAVAIASDLSIHQLKLAPRERFPCDAPYLYFTVREPFPSRSSASLLVTGKVTTETPLEVVSQMAEDGVIFSDGIERDALEFNSGVQACISVADKRGHLVV